MKTLLSLILLLIHAGPAQADLDGWDQFSFGICNYNIDISKVIGARNVARMQREAAEGIVWDIHDGNHLEVHVNAASAEEAVAVYREQAETFFRENDTYRSQIIVRRVQVCDRLTDRAQQDRCEQQSVVAGYLSSLPPTTKIMVLSQRPPGSESTGEPGEGLFNLTEAPSSFCRLQPPFLGEGVRNYPICHDNYIPWASDTVTVPRCSDTYAELFTTL